MRPANIVVLLPVKAVPASYSKDPKSRTSSEHSVASAWRTVMQSGWRQRPVDHGPCSGVIGRQTPHFDGRHCSIFRRPGHCPHCVFLAVGPQPIRLIERSLLGSPVGHTKKSNMTYGTSLLWMMVRCLGSL